MSRSSTGNFPTNAVQRFPLSPSARKISNAIALYCKEKAGWRAPLCFQLGTQFEPIENVHGSLRCVPIAVRTDGRRKLAPKAWIIEREANSLYDRVPFAGDLDDIAGTQTVVLPRADIDRRDFQGGRLDDAAAGIADHRGGMTQQTEITTRTQIGDDTQQRIVLPPLE